MTTHAVQGEILGLAKQNNVGSLRTALAIYAQEAAANGDEELQHGIDNIESLFPDYKDLRSGAPELLTRDQGWVDAVSVPARWTLAMHALGARASRKVSARLLPAT